MNFYIYLVSSIFQVGQHGAHGLRVLGHVVPAPKPDPEHVREVHVQGAQ